MSSGRVALKATNFGGYVAIENAGLGMIGGHEFTRQFLEANRKFFDKVADGSGYAKLAIRAARVPAFIAYCASNSIEAVQS